MEFPGLLRRTWRRWRDEHGSRQGAGLAFYALFSLAPLVMISSWLAPPELADRLLWSLLLPDALADTTRELVDSTRAAVSTRWVVLAVFAMIYAPVRGFLQLQATLNELWGVRAVRGPGPVNMVRRKLLAFASVGLAIVLLAAGAAVGGLMVTGAQAATAALPRPAPVGWVESRAYSFGVMALLLLAIFRTLPDARVAWRDAVGGAVFTAVLLTVGREGVVLYLQSTTRTLAFGPAGSVVAVLLYTYYSAQVLLFGAAFTWALAEAGDRPIRPGPGAVRLQKVRGEAA